MLREYVVHLLEQYFPHPMELAQTQIETYSLVAFLESSQLQQQLYLAWLPRQDQLLDPQSLNLSTDWGSNKTHTWYLSKFLTALYRAIEQQQLEELARIHTMFFDISPKQHAQLKLLLSDFTQYLRWQQRFCAEQYQIAFRPLIR